MARYFRDLSIHLGYNQRLPDGFSEKDFNLSTHNVQDIFLYLIPPRFEFGNILKLNIIIKGENETLEDDEAMDCGGYFSYSYLNFDFNNYFKLSKKDQNKLILKVLKNVLERIPEPNENKKQIVFGITKQIEELNFEYSFESSLTKIHREMKLIAIVEIRINSEGQNAYLKIINKGEDVIIEEHLLKNKVYDFHNNLHKSKWIGNVFQILNRDGGVFKEFMVDTK